MATEPTTRKTPLWEQDHFSNLVDDTTGAVGRVVSSEREPAGSHKFFFWASEDALSLDVGHIVVTFSEEAAVIGVVDEPRRYSDLVSFLDDFYDRRMELALPDEGPTLRPEILVFSVKVLATRHQRDDVSSKRPAVNGPVFFATQAAIEYALGDDDFSGAKIPALMHVNGNYVRDNQGNIVTDEKSGLPNFQKTPIYLDEDYLLGPEAGHANWTGQSGLATKTSHALFLISAIFQTLGKKGTSVAALMFNVKGPDLLWLDKPAKPEEYLKEAYEAAGWRAFDDKQDDAYKALGLMPQAFGNLNIFAPFRPDSVPRSVNSRVDLSGFKNYASLNTSRTHDGETGPVHPILWSLQHALSFLPQVFEYNDLDDKLYGLISEFRDMGIGSLDELFEEFAKINAILDDPEGPDTWRGHHKATIRKAQNRFNGLKAKLGGLLADGIVEYGREPKMAGGKFESQEMRVVDISSCNTKAQELIVSSTIRDVWNMAEKSDMGVEKLIIFVDELNKYGAAGTENSLRNTLVEIAARGRHLNVVLLGAQQFRSKIDDEILGNCGTSFYGRIGDEEIINAAYRSISETSKQELLGLRKGHLLVRHAHFREPLFGTFPLPPAIPGIYGDRVFSSSIRDGDDSRPAEGLFRTVQRLMGDYAPSMSDVKNACLDVSDDDIHRIREWAERAYRSEENRRRNMRKIWSTLERQLNTARSMNTQL